MKNKIKALADFLGIEQDQITFNEDTNEFITNSGECYKVFTDKEADDAAKEEITYSLWAFNADFILVHTEFYKESTDKEDAAFIDALHDMQARLCEAANAIVRALIVNINEFVYDAIDADGRGHFISWYDGEENESNGLFIYRSY